MVIADTLCGSTPFGDGSARRTATVGLAVRSTALRGPHAQSNPLSDLHRERSPAGARAPASSHGVGRRGPGARRREASCLGHHRPLNARGRFEQAVAGQTVASQTTCGRVIAFTRTREILSSRGSRSELQCAQVATMFAAVSRPPSARRTRCSAVRVSGCHGSVGLLSRRFVLSRQ